MPIYTKKGDRGKTGLFGCKDRVGKNSARIEAIGAVDELNSLLGIIVSISEDKKTIQIIKDVQSNLLTIGSILAGSNLRLTKRETAKLEKQIDIWDKILPPLTNFILPGGSEVSSHLQFARSLARRAERRVVSLSEKEKIKSQILMYLNRLSDFLFMFARITNFKLKIEDEAWKPSS